MIFLAIDEKGAFFLRVLHITTSVFPQSAAYRCHKALLKMGIDSSIYVLDDSVVDADVMYDKKVKMLSRAMRRIKMMKEKGKEQFIKKIFHSSPNAPVSLGFGSMLNRDFIKEFNPDVINLHWICGAFVSISDLDWLRRYPLVWTLHDSWAFTGGCHVPQFCKKWNSNCNECNIVGRRFGVDLAEIIFRRKLKYYSKMDVKIVGVSAWIADCARNSTLFHDKNIYCVHNTLNQELFKPKDKNVVREILGIPKDKKVILFGAMNSTSDENKGFRFLYNAIRHVIDRNLIKNAELMVFGSDEPQNPPDFGAPVHYMGRYRDNLSLSMLYSAADVMIVPSKSEAFPNTVLESIACGIPVVAFRIGGIPDQIQHKVNGDLAEPYNSEDLARGIIYVLEDKMRWEVMSKEARKKAETCFNEKCIASEMVKVYEKAIFDKKAGEDKHVYLS